MSLQPQPAARRGPASTPASYATGHGPSSKSDVRAKFHKPKKRDQQTMSIAPPLAEIPGTRIGFCGVGRRKSIRRNQGNAVGEPQFNFLAVTFRGLRQ